MDDDVYAEVLDRVKSLWEQQPGLRRQNGEVLRACWLVGKHLLDYEGRI